MALIATVARGVEAEKRVAEFPRVAHTATVGSGLRTVRAIIAKTGRAILPADWPDAIVAGLAIRIAEQAVLFLTTRAG